MILKKTIINEYQNNGVVILKNIIDSFWLKVLSKGINKNFKNPSKYKCVYEKKITKNYFMMITVTGKK